MSSPSRPAPKPAPAPRPRPAAPPAVPQPSLVPRSGLVPIVCVILTIAVVAAANIAWLTSPHYGRVEKSVAKSVEVGTVPIKSHYAATLLAPNRVQIPKISAIAPIKDVATTPDGELDVPENPKVVGWWSPGAKPGASKGTAVFAGHINYAGVKGSFSDIGELRPGDRVYVFGAHAGTKTRVDFTVSAVRTYHKTHLPYQEIFDQSVSGRLALVTCGGPFDASTGNYLDNVVVYAVPVSSSSV